MPTVAELDRLQALLSRLSPLAGKRPGQLIESADWNELVGLLLEVTRVVIAEEREGVVAAHDHPDQVGVGWLDPKLRLLVERGPLADPPAVARVAAVERDLARLDGRLGSVDDRLSEARTRITDVATRDLTRAADMDRLGRRVDGVGDAREDVLAVRETLHSLQGDLKRVTAAAARLEVDGNPIDARVLVERIGDLERLRDAWTAADGTLMDAAELERRIAALRSKTVTDEDLRDAIAGVEVVFTDADRAALLEEARASTRDELDRAIPDVRGELRSDVLGVLDQRLSGVDQLISRTVAEAVDPLRADLLASVDDRAGSLVDRRVEELAGTLRVELERGLGAVQGEIDQRLGDLQRNLAESITKEVDARLDRFGQSFDVRLRGIEDKIGGLDGRVGSLTNDLRTVSTRVEVVRREALDASSLVRTDLNRQLDTIRVSPVTTDPRRDAVITRTLVGGVQPPSAPDLAPVVRLEVDAARRDLERGLAERIATEAAAEVELASAGMDGKVREIVRDELTLVRDEVAAAVGEHTAALERRLPGLVAEEVGRAAASLTEVIRAEIEMLLPQVRTTVDAQLDERLGRR